MRFPSKRGIAAAMAISGVLMTPACGDTTLNPDTSTGQTLTDEFSDVLHQQEARHHEFMVQKAGDVTVILASVSPLATIAIGLAIGTFDGTTCTLVPGTQNENARVGSTIDGRALAPGILCVIVYDVGNIVDSTDYVVRVNHS